MIKQYVYSTKRVKYLVNGFPFSFTRQAISGQYSEIINSLYRKSYKKGSVYMCCVVSVLHIVLGVVWFG
jgi:hypothetical protein